MAPFERLKAAFFGLLTPATTPAGQEWLHRAPQTPETPVHNVNGKRPCSEAERAEPDKRRKILGGIAAYLTPSSFKAGPEDESRLGSDPDEWRYISNVVARSVRHSQSATPSSKNRLRSYASPQSKLKSPQSKFRSPEDKSSVQPHKPFDEADLKRFEIDKARAAHALQANNMRRAGFGEDPIKVYLKIVMRGWEAIFPKSWRPSFESLPSILFANNPKHEYIKAFSENQFRGMKFFRGLLNVGARARDAALDEVDAPPSRQPQELIRREIDRFARWAFADGGVSDVTPTLTIVSTPEEIEPEKLERKMTRRLTKLKREWKRNLAVCTEVDDHGEAKTLDQLCAAPTIYGMSINGLGISIVVLQDEDDGRRRPFVQQFFWKIMDDVDYDVWNSIAVAIVVMHCRAKMVSLRGVMDDYDKATRDRGLE